MFIDIGWNLVIVAINSNFNHNKYIIFFRIEKAFHFMCIASVSIQNIL